MTADPKEEITQHLNALRAFSLSLTHNRSLADDMVQDTIEKAWKNIDSFQPGTNMRAWLFTILRNTFYSNRRRAVREVSDPDGFMVDQLSEKPAHDGRLQMNDFRTALAQLPDEQREVLLLVGACGYSYEEAADMCGTAVGTVKSRLNRGRARLADLMDLDAGDPTEMTDATTLSVLSQMAAAA
ncbi:RNA polymerase sigma factor [uncultured Roseobacter sp.]|uniref:RNA polymerase sigma factor n=1 Tax=uncultured Roseobacter sp. TaxID=114847 RepID=UPI00263466CC|nr:RNA polymerase sigma factor [uncultured Roseobacter sp.]